MLHDLRFAPDWASQIERLRNAVTEETHLIRFDNTFYRMCRPGDGRFTVLLHPGFESRANPVRFEMVERDLYVTSINGWPFTRYSSDLNGLADPSTRDLNTALRKLPEAQGNEAFLLRSLLVFAVAESLRNDRVALAIEQSLRSSQGSLRGVPTQLPWSLLLNDHARRWGKAGEAIYAALSPEGQRIAVKRRAGMTDTERRFSERVDLSTASPEIRATARGVKVIKWPDAPVLETSAPKGWGKKPG